METVILPAFIVVFVQKVADLFLGDFLVGDDPFQVVDGRKIGAVRLPVHRRQPRKLHDLAVIAARIVAEIQRGRLDDLFALRRPSPLLVTPLRLCTTRSCGSAKEV